MTRENNYLIKAHLLIDANLLIDACLLKYSVNPNIPCCKAPG